MRAGSVVVFEISSVAWPSHSGSNGVTLVMIPQRAYEDLPTQIVSTLRGMRKYSTVRPSANELGGIRQDGPLKSHSMDESKFFGSTTAPVRFEKILNSSAIRMS